eukprot:gene8011-10857_t
MSSSVENIRIDMANTSDQVIIPPRVLNIDPHSDVAITSYANSIYTTKYTWYTWLPKSLFDQFRRVANCYFVLISVLMFIGYYATYLFQTPLDPYSTVVIFVVVLLITCIKEGVEDLARAKSDKNENNKEITIITFGPNNEVIETVKKSQNIKPGDIIKLSGKMAAPTDMLLILTSLHMDGNKCYIETANIDGETNLKLREAPAGLFETHSRIIEAGVPVPDLFDCTVEFEQPNNKIHTFVGSLKLKTADEAIPLSADNIILRSALFSNTDWGYGIAIYCGQETKIQMNNRFAPSKMSRLEQLLNQAIVIIFIAQAILVSVSVISIYLLGFNDKSKLPYVFPANDGGIESILPLWLEQWFIFFILYCNFIPISLYVTIELVNLGQAYLIAVDLDLYQPDLDVACNVRSSNLVQELGMVSNIFSDKTGTLTRNEMKFVKFNIHGNFYDINWDEKKTEVNLSQFGKDEQAVREFFKCLVTCHTVIREKDGTYRAESPDELALVEGVGNYECYLQERGSKEMNVLLYGQKKVYEIMAVNPFNSDRKRMSVLMKDPSDNTYWVMCKGADNIMLPLCELNDAREKDVIMDSLNQFANMGLRTLAIAQKQLSERDALEWFTKYKAATLSPVNRDAMISAVSAELELNMTLLGITAIEDRLQDEVPEVIADLANAGIVLWMLTGDKLETAINIGRSCKLILNDTSLLYITNVSNSSEMLIKLREVYNEITKEPINKNTTLVLDGPSFASFDTRSVEQRSMLLRIGQGCRSVIACRLTPLNKKDLVALVKNDTFPVATCLSIGDGANDVPMILEGNVGVGIYGKEGRQAANNADFAIGEFKFLRKLLLVHGRWNYIRQSKTFLYSMHKNLVLTFTLFWFSYFSAVSGTSLYESWVYSSFNVALGLPIIFFGIMDRDISSKFVLQNPQTYTTGRDNVYLNIYVILIWILNAVVYAVVICLLSYYVLAPTFTFLDLYTAGTIVFMALVFSLQYKIGFFHHQWAWPHIFAMFISYFGIFIFFLILSQTQDDYYDIANETYALPIYWFFGFFTIPLCAIMIDVISYDMFLFFKPTDEMIFRELDTEGMKITKPNSKQTIDRSNSNADIRSDSVDIGPIHKSYDNQEKPHQEYEMKKLSV